MVDASEFNRRIIEEFRANGGRVAQFAHMTLLVLHTTGAKSGLPRLNPAAYMADDDRFVIFASNAGRPSNPAWFYNLAANPKVRIEVGDETFPARATIAEEPERSRLFKQMAESHPIFVEYQAKTTRIIPVVSLNREGT